MVVPSRSLLGRGASHGARHRPWAAVRGAEHRAVCPGILYLPRVRKLVNYFLRGLVVLAPLVITLWITYELFRRVDGLLGLPIPGLGLVLTVAVITMFGFLASNLITRGWLAALESVFARLPFVRLLYSSTRDLLDAFVGEKRRFDRPVAITLTPGGTLKAMGFVTRDSLEQLGMPGYVAVYLPQSYNFAGNLLMVPAAQVEPVPAESADVMTFIVSGGVSGGSSLPPRNGNLLPPA